MSSLLTPALEETKFVMGEKTLQKVPRMGSLIGDMNYNNIRMKNKEIEGKILSLTE